MFWLISILSIVALMCHNACGETILSLMKAYSDTTGKQDVMIEAVLKTSAEDRYHMETDGKMLDEDYLSWLDEESAIMTEFFGKRPDLLPVFFQRYTTIMTRGSGCDIVMQCLLKHASVRSAITDPQQNVFWQHVLELLSSIDYATYLEIVKMIEIERLRLGIACEMISDSAMRRLDVEIRGNR
jgi:hypothetical protein